MSTALGIEIKDFWYHGWPGEDWYYEPEGFEIDDEAGEFALDIGETYELRDTGLIYWQGDADKCPSTFNGVKVVSYAMDFEDVFLAWREKESYAYYVIRVPIESKEEVETLLSSLAYKNGCYSAIVK